MAFLNRSDLSISAWVSGSSSTCSSDLAGSDCLTSCGTISFLTSRGGACSSLTGLSGAMVSCLPDETNSFKPALVTTLAILTVLDSFCVLVSERLCCFCCRTHVGSAFQYPHLSGSCCFCTLGSG